MNLTSNTIQSYLRGLYGEGVQVTTLGEMSGGVEGAELKEFGYGKPLRVDFTLPGGESRSVVISSMRPGGGFGHDHMADRAAVMIWQHSCLANLPRLE